MTTPEQLLLDFDAAPPAVQPPVRATAQVVQLAAFAARRDAEALAGVYDRIRESIAHIDVSRARRWALASEVTPR